MQYAQRKLQRSVTDNRRLRSGRANVSTSGIVAIMTRCRVGSLAPPIHRSLHLQERKPGALAGKKGPRRDLSIEFLAPAARHRPVAPGTASVRRHPVLADQVAVSGDEQLTARGAASVFERADL